MPGRRRKRRFPLELPARIASPAGASGSALVKNLSEAGAMILVDDPVEFGAVARLSFVFDGAACEATGRVLRCASRDERLAIAIELVHTNQPFLDAIQTLRQAHDEGRSILERISKATLELAP